MPLSPGTTLGPYEIVAPIGAGDMGEVSQARDTRLDRTVAIKVLPEHVAADPDLKQRFEREAKTISSLNHPHICTLHDIGTQDGIDFLVMEYLEGDTLAQRSEKGALPLNQALQIAVEIADALDKAHRQGIVHRDLKPGNVMLTKSGAKLLDFGLAKLRPAEATAGLTAMPTQEAPLTEQGTIFGTFQYMAPEQLEGKEADAPPLRPPAGRLAQTERCSSTARTSAMGSDSTRVRSTSARQGLSVAPNSPTSRSSRQMAAGLAFTIRMSASSRRCWCRAGRRRSSRTHGHP